MEQDSSSRYVSVHSLNLSTVKESSNREFIGALVSKLESIHEDKTKQRIFVNTNGPIFYIGFDAYERLALSKIDEIKATVKHSAPGHNPFGEVELMPGRTFGQPSRIVFTIIPYAPITRSRSRSHRRSHTRPRSASPSLDSHSESPSPSPPRRRRPSPSPPPRSPSPVRNRSRSRGRQRPRPDESFTSKLRSTIAAFSS